MILLIDNYDSFTWNLVQRFGEIAPDIPVEVHRNDCVTGDEIAAKAPSHLVISPGPCTPDEAGISCDVIRRFAGRMPILGVCLGHQSIGQVFGGKIVRAKQLMHGKVDRIERVIELEGSLDDSQRQRLLEIADKCPVHQTLHRKNEIVSRLAD